MSGKIPFSEYRRGSVKCRMFTDKENMAIQNGKHSEGKNDVRKKKGLSSNAENRIVCTTSVQSSSVSKTKFPIYFDGDDEIERSRPRMRKDVCRKDIRGRRDSKELGKIMLFSKKVAEPKVAESSDLRPSHISRRTRSSSNCQYKVSSAKTSEITGNLFHNRRSYSESRKIPSQYTHCIAQSSASQKIKLTDDVKKRTLSSIEMWKNKTRKSHTGTVPKNIGSNLLNVDKTKAKTKLKKNFVTGSMHFQSEADSKNSAAINPNKNIEEPIQKVNSLTNILNTLELENIRFFSNEIAGVLEEDKSHLEVPANTSTNISTPLDGPSTLPLTPTKVRYEKHIIKPSTVQESDVEIICSEIIYMIDYLEDVPDTERKKEDNTPRLSSRFLRENVNAEQRRLIVGYLIRIGVHCNYPCNIIYQTIKLFNVAIDRILVETNDIQLIALACLWITLKREIPGHKIPSVIKLCSADRLKKKATVILKLAKDLYTNQEKYLLMYEKKILSAIKFHTRFADPFSLLSYYILTVNRDSMCNIIKPKDIAYVYNCSSYMIDLSMLDESLCDIPAYVIAIAAVDLSLRFIYSNEPNGIQTCSQVWRNKQSLTEWEERVMNSTKRLMIQHALENEKFGSNIIYKKYMRSKHGRITTFLQHKLKTLVIL